MQNKRSEDPVDSTRRKNSRLGHLLFLIYSFCYLVFTLVNAFAPSWAEWQPAAGINLAIWWGLSLIGLAFVLSLIYGFACSNESQRATPSRPGSDCEAEERGAHETKGKSKGASAR
jgi:uncharacterized membrane protein (DUF485 family)